MGFGERIDRLPVEDWAALVGRTVRRLRRRLARRPRESALAAVAVLITLSISANALWSQDERHPAPFLGEVAPPAPQASQVVATGETGVATDPRVVPVAPRPPREPRAGDAPSDPLIATIQEGLAAAGFHEGPASGQLDAATRSAIEAFESDAGLAVTGEPSLGLVAALASVSDVQPDPAQTPRAVDGDGIEALAGIADVRSLQALLNRKGYGPLNEDGAFGPMTRSALERLVREEGVPRAAADAVLARVLAGESA